MPPSSRLCRITDRCDSLPNYEYVVILEDDLELANDAVAFFNGMTWPMSRDPTIFCACAHQDNAYHAMSVEEKYHKKGSANTLRYENLLSGAFSFRRGEHFMAPGFMTSRNVYNSVIRKTWFDLAGELLPWAKQRMYKETGTLFGLSGAGYGMYLLRRAADCTSWCGRIYCT